MSDLSVPLRNQLARERNICAVRKSFHQCLSQSIEEMIASYAFDLFSILTAAFMPSRFAIGEGEEGAWSRNVNVVSRGEIGGCIPARSLCEGEPIAMLSFLTLVRLSRIYDAIFWHRCESFYIFRMHVLGYAARVPRDEGECEGWGGEGGLARNDSGAQWDRRTGILRMEFGLAVSRCIQIVFLPLPPQR